MFNVHREPNLVLNWALEILHFEKQNCVRTKNCNVLKMARTKLKPIPKETPICFYKNKKNQNRNRKVLLKIKLNSNEFVIICTMKIKEKETCELLIF
jgi:peroxiredoxin family protein